MKKEEEPSAHKGKAKGAKDEADLLARIDDLTADLTRAGAVLKLPPRDRLLREGLRPLIARGIVAADFTPLDPALLRFYAAPLAHFQTDAASRQT